MGITDKYAMDNCYVYIYVTVGSCLLNCDICCLMIKLNLPNAKRNKPIWSQNPTRKPEPPATSNCLQPSMRISDVGLPPILEGACR